MRVLLIRKRKLQRQRQTSTHGFNCSALRSYCLWSLISTALRRCVNRFLLICLLQSWVGWPLRRPEVVFPGITHVVVKEVCPTEVGQGTIAKWQCLEWLQSVCACPQGG